MFHDLHLPRLPDESWAEYEERLLAILREGAGSAMYNAMLDFVEAFVRQQYEIAISANDDEFREKRIAARVGHRIYNALAALKRVDDDVSEKQIESFAGRQPDLSVHSNSRYASSRARKAAAVAASRTRNL